ncbi:CAP domain-containing protein [Salinilacihabitans rarus]|uniref:CAP domain-containing protein n=1 Tax=Salinilacihabitans rarus TaxID=2961596 RepID=UPI0020C8AB2F|nr:CAP domain-containing protein [Salinilacihabitans rarus]
MARELHARGRTATRTLCWLGIGLLLAGLLAPTAAAAGTASVDDATDGTNDALADRIDVDLAWVDSLLDGVAEDGAVETVTETGDLDVEVDVGASGDSVVDVDWITTDRDDDAVGVDDSDSFDAFDDFEFDFDFGDADEPADDGADDDGADESEESDDDETDDEGDEADDEVDDDADDADDSTDVEEPEDSDGTDDADELEDSDGTDDADELEDSDGTDDADELEDSDGTDADEPEDSDDTDDAADGLSYEEQVERAIHEEVNEVRTDRGLRALEYDEDLAAVARAHSEDMAENRFLSHTGSDGSTVGDRYDRAGVTCQAWGENALYNYHAGEDPETVAQKSVQQWMDSPGHRENLLDSRWDAEGIGVAVTDDGRLYATQNFGSNCN